MMKWIYCWFMNEMNFNPRSPQFNFNLKWNAANARIEFHIKITSLHAGSERNLFTKWLMKWINDERRPRPLAFVRHHSIAAFTSLIPQLNFFPLFRGVPHCFIQINMNYVRSVSAHCIQINCGMKEKNGM